MKLNKTIGRVATTLVATAMLASMAVVPAFAEDVKYGTTGTPGTPLTKINIEKELVMPTYVNMPTDANFSFSISPVTDIGSDTVLTDEGAGNQKYDVNPGIADSGVNVAGSVTSASFSDPTATTIDDKSYNVATATVELTLPTCNFENPGIYKYTIDEANVPSEDYIDITGSLDLYLMVEYKDFTPDDGEDNKECKITGAYVKKAGTKEDTWTNYYMLDKDLTSKAGDLKVTKTVAGTMGDHGDSFTFTITNLPAGKTFTGEYNDDTADVSLTSSVNTFELTDGQTITIKGLDAGDYTITEAADDSTDKGYTVSFSDDTDDNASNGITLKVEGGKVDDNAVNTTCTNTRNAVTPTGIVMNVAPYALLVVIAAAGCFVFLRKRRED